MLLRSVNGNQHRDPQLIDMQRMKDCRGMSLEWNLYIKPLPPKAQKLLWKKSRSSGWLQGNSVFQEAGQSLICLSAIMTACTRPSKYKLDRSPAQGWGRWARSPNPNWGTIGNWELWKEIPFSLRVLHPVEEAPGDRPTLRNIWRHKLDLIGLKN